ncbi:MAG: TIGR01458 family HAD-type hydrolase [Bacteroidota bacterium]
MNMTALLIDLDGVIYVQEKLIPGAIEAIQFIRQKNIPHRFVTNTTTHSRRQITGRLAQVGITIPHDYLFTAPVAAAQYLKKLVGAKCFFYTNPNIAEEFDGIAQVESEPTHIVIGDVGEGFSYEMMNRAFNMIHGGAEIIALQKNRFWITREGLKLDAGAFIAALEYATGKTATVFGKPAVEFFHQACVSLELPPGDVAMIGDDLRADIEGAAAAGLMTIFVRTGKDKDKPLTGVEKQPGIVLNSIADLPTLLQHTK